MRVSWSAKQQHEAREKKTKSCIERRFGADDRAACVEAVSRLCLSYVHTEGLDLLAQTFLLVPSLEIKCEQSIVCRLRRVWSSKLTSKNPDMKSLGNLLSPRKLSSLKYDMICVVWRQKFIVS